ncbi:MAG: helix-turn-helix transcriptional regulator [Oscillospiraceae bacterium]|nr:helix-turn-helix transcriptional regulator [Oscillospiraceae bacterium]
MFLEVRLMIRPSNFCRTIRRIRKEQELTPEQMAEKLGMTCPAYKRYEAGEQSPDVPLLLKISDVFSVKIMDLVEKESNAFVLVIEKTPPYKGEFLRCAQPILGPLKGEARGLRQTRSRPPS